MNSGPECWSSHSVKSAPAIRKPPDFVCGAFGGPDPRGCLGKNSVQRLSCAALERAFPNHEHAPAGGGERRQHVRIVYAVAGDFLFPEVAAGRRPAKEMAVVAVPKAAVNKNYRAVARKNDVWFTRQTARMETVAEAIAVKPVAHGDFRAGVDAADAGHHPAAYGGFDYISH